jgi:vacuolar protein sorting-associated protein IST1
MANSRIQLTNNKKSAAVKHKKREIATLLGEKKDEKARIKVEHVIREDFLIEAYELLELLCELVFERVKYIASCKECPPDLVEAVSSLIWAATRVEIAEMEQIKKQLIKKFGSKFASDAENNVICAASLGFSCRFVAQNTLLAFFKNNDFTTFDFLAPIQTLNPKRSY